jgi:hypothetical protein
LSAHLRDQGMSTSDNCGCGHTHWGRASRWHISERRARRACSDTLDRAWRKCILNPDAADTRKVIRQGRPASRCERYFGKLRSKVFELGSPTTNPSRASMGVRAVQRVRKRNATRRSAAASRIPCCRMSRTHAWVRGVGIEGRPTTPHPGIGGGEGHRKMQCRRDTNNAAAMLGSELTQNYI